MNPLISEQAFIAQQHSALDNGITPKTIVTATQVESGDYVVLSYFKDDVWQLPSSLFTTSTRECRRKINFNRYPKPFQNIMKQVLNTEQ